LMRETPVDSGADASWGLRPTYHQGAVAHLPGHELGRAARDLIESVRLGRLLERQGRRLVGCSDGYDSSLPQWKQTLTFNAMIHETFVHQLREKVDRGMRDKFDRGGNIRPPSFGYKLVDAMDASGNLLRDHQGQPIREKVVGELEDKWVKTAFEIFVRQGKSPMAIGKFFNKHEVGGRDTWDGPMITKLLKRRTYVGEEIEGMTRTIRDPDTGKVINEKRPESEWQRRCVPHLRIVDDELFASAQEMLQQRSEAHKARMANNPKRLDVGR
jgi:site-specific DNA recombinase